MKDSRREFFGMLLIGGVVGAVALFPATGFGTAFVAQLWTPLYAILPVALVLLLVGASRFWMPDGINKTSGFLLGLAIGLVGAFATCLGIIAYIGTHIEYHAR